MLLYLRDAALRVFASSDTDPDKIEIDYKLLFWALGIFSGQTSYVHTNKHRPPEEDSPMPLGLPLDAPSLAAETPDIAPRRHVEGVVLPPTDLNIETLGSFALSQAELELMQDISQSFPQTASTQPSVANQSNPAFTSLALNLNGFDLGMFDSEMATAGDMNAESWGWDPNWYQATTTITTSTPFPSGGETQNRGREARYLG